MVSGRYLLKKNYRTGWIKQGSHQCTCEHILHKNEKKRTHISLSPRVPGIHNDWSLNPYIFSTILEIPISIPHFVYSGNNYAHLENTALNDEKKKKQTHALPIWHKRKTDVDPQKACLQVQIAWRIFMVNASFHW